MKWKVPKLRSILAPLHQWLEASKGYSVVQWLGRPTVQRFRKLIGRNVAFKPGGRYLDLGCGIGNYRDCFPEGYWGIDVNPNYIDTARRRWPGRFDVMDGTRLAFDDGIFDAVVTIATTHHLTDKQLIQMAVEALRVTRGGHYFHVVDAILPIAPIRWAKETWFRLDRGGFPRRRERLLELLLQAGEIAHEEVLFGPLHDTIYVKLAARLKATAPLSAETARPTADRP